MGFDVEAVLAAGRSHGLLGMRERATLLDGRVVIESTPGSDTNVLAIVPLGKYEQGESP